MNPLLALDFSPANVSSDEKTHVLVAPLVRSGGHLHTLTYTIPKDAPHPELFSLVRIRLRGKLVFGIITETKTSPIQKALPIEEVYYGGASIFTDSQKYLIHHLETYYGAECTKIFSFFLPPLQPQKIKKVTLNQKKSFKQNIQELPKQERNLCFERYDKLPELFDSLSIAKCGGQILILCPDMLRTEYALQAYKKINNAPPAFSFSHKETEAKQFTHWHKVRQGEPCTTIGTKSSLGLPFTNLKMVIVIDTHDAGHKQWDAYPRLYAPEMAKTLAQKTGALHVTANRFEAISEKTQTPKINRPIHKVHLGNSERTHLSESTVQALIKTAGTRIVIVPDKGYAQRIYCPSCNHVYRCSLCQTPLAAIGEQKKAWCRIHSKTPIDIDAACPSCGEHMLRFVGAGVDRIAEDLQKNSPSIPVYTYRGDTEEIFPKNSIILGTENILQHKALSVATLLVHRACDRDIGRIHAEATEDALYFVYTLDAILPKETPIYLESTHEEHPFFEALNDPNLWAQKENELRKRFGDAPWRTGFKISLGRENNEASVSELKKIKTYLSKHLPEDSTCSDPFTLSPSIYKNRAWAAIYLRIPTPLFYETLSKIAEITKSMDIRIDPWPKDLYAV